MDKLHTNCPLCSSHSTSILVGYERAYLLRCNNCSFVFSNQIPSDKELEAYYSDEYELTSFFSPITAKRYGELLDSFEHLRQTNNLLDIGVGNGFFAEIALQRGWNVYGTELTDETLVHAAQKGINMSKGKLENLDFEANSFDVVVCIEVIEHVSFPRSFVAEIHALLRKGGVVYLTTPNFNSLSRRRLKSHYDVINFPNHLSYFTVKTLSKLLTSNGFVKQSITTTGMSRTRRKTSLGKSNQAFVSETSDDEILRHRIEKNWMLRSLKRVINGFLSLFRLGDSIKATFIKQ